MSNFIVNPYRYSTGAAFAPDDISNLEVWNIAGSLDGSLNDGDTLTDWPSEVNSATYQFDTISGTPTLEKNEMNGESVVQCLGASSERVRDLSNLTWGTEFALVYVFNHSTPSGTNYVYRTSTSQFYLITRAGGTIECYATNGSIVLFTGAFTPSPTLGNDMVLIANVDFNGATSTLDLYINGTSTQGSDSDTASATTLTDAYINLPSSALYPDIKIAEHLVYLQQLTSGNISDLMTYYGNKYNISIS